MKNQYDVIICGASISGLYCGYKLAKNGWKVAIFDRKKEIGLPVRCGEATGNRAEINRFFDVDEEFIATDILGISVFHNEELSIKKEMKDAGVILHRHKFEQHIAKLAKKHGAEIFLEKSVTSLLGKKPIYDGVVIDEKEEFFASYIIGADGAESLIGRWAEITKTLPLKDAFSSCQYRVKTDKFNNNYMNFFVGEETIPKGYLWVFSKSEEFVSVGAGYYGYYKELPKVVEFVDKFIEKNMPNCEKSHFITGSGPTDICPKKLNSGNVVVVGDSARQVNPLTVGGIMNSLEASDLMCNYMLKTKKLVKNYKILDKYSKKWSRRPRIEQKVFYMIKEIIISISDQKLKDFTLKFYEIFKSSTNREKAFKFPIFSVLKLFVFMFPLVWKHKKVFLIRNS